MAVKNILVFKNDTINLSKHPTKEEFWLYDYTRGMNLSMRAKSEQQAFIEALTYYQKRLTAVEKELNFITDKVEGFISGLGLNED